MLVDVVTAVHAPYARFLPATWESLQHQTHTNWTWLLQVDGPPDSVLDALASCGALRDSRVRVASNQTSEGPAVTRNVALGRGTAPLVQNVDADDELEPTALAHLSAAFLSHPTAGYAVGHARDLMPQGQLHEHELPLESGTLTRGALLPFWNTQGRRHKVPVHPAGVMWKRALLVELGGWSALHGMEDTGLLMAASALAEGVLLDHATLRYRRHNSQRSTEDSLFAGGGGQISLVRQRVALLASRDPWSDRQA